MMKSLDGLRNLNEKIQKSTHFSIKIETNCRETPKFSDLNKFLDLDWDFLVWTLMSRQNREVSISIKISQSSSLAFLKCRDKVFEMLRLRFSIETTSRQIETPRLNFSSTIVYKPNFFFQKIYKTWNVIVNIWRWWWYVAGWKTVIHFLLVETKVLQ